MSRKNLELLVVHGGPGLTSSYIRKPLADALPDCSLKFFEQPAASGNAFPSLTDFIDSCRSALKSADSPAIFCHSWGCLLLMLTLDHYPDVFSFRCNIIFSNPLPLTSAGFQRCQTRLFSRIQDDEDDMEAIGKLVESENLEDHSAAFRRLYHYYSLQAPPEDFTPAYDHRLFTKITNELGAYDLSKVAESTYHSIQCLYGERDFIQPSDCDHLELLFPAHVMQNTGHFPFIESAAAFRPIVLDRLKE